MAGGSGRIASGHFAQAVTSSQSIQAISFDVGGTLIEPWPSVGHVYAAVARELGVGAFDPEQLNARFAEAWRAKAGFDYTREAWAGLVVSACGGSDAEFGVHSRFFCAVYDRFIEASAWRLYEDVIPVLDHLRDRGFKLAAISNWDDRLRPLLRNLNIDGRFDVIEVSGESGFHKPHPEIFQRAARALGVDPASILHVGDSEREDVEGATGAGLRAILLRRKGGKGMGREIGSLAGVLEGL